MTRDEWLDAVPFAKIFCAVSLGIVAVGGFSEPPTLPLLILPLAIVATILLKKYVSYFAILSLILLGGSLSYLDKDSKPPYNIEHTSHYIIEQKTTLKGVYKGTEHPSKHKFLILDSDRNYNLGDTIHATVICEPLQFSHHSLRKLVSNPRNISTAKIIETKSIASNNHYTAPIAPLMERLNSAAEARLKQLKISQDDIEVINGMILGNRDNISKETQELFAATSLSHILAISGMHIGIIFMIVNTLLFALRRSFRGRVISSIIVIAILWLYTLFVGAPISAIRATAMFSLLQIVLLRSYSTTQIYNSLFAVATLMILYNHENLFDVGFQLSFTAVLSIIIFSPIINGYIRKRNILTDIISLTISAQLLTTPIIAYYFGTVSFVSIACNTIGSLTILVITLLALIYIIVPNVAVEYLLNLLFNSLRAVLEFITNIPYSHLSDINFTVIDIIFYYTIIIIIFIQKKLLLSGKKIKKPSNYLSCNKLDII